MCENGMREKNISMLLKLSLIVLFASSIVQQNFASNEGDDQSPSRFWGWGRNVVRLVGLTSAAIAVGSAAKNLYNNRQIKILSKKRYDLLHAIDIENMRLAEGFVVERQVEPGVWKKDGKLRPGLLPPIGKNLGPAEIAKRLERYEIEKMLKDKSFFGGWVDLQEVAHNNVAHNNVSFEEKVEVISDDIQQKISNEDSENSFSFRYRDPLMRYGKAKKREERTRLRESSRFWKNIGFISTPIAFATVGLTAKDKPIRVGIFSATTISLYPALRAVKDLRNPSVSMDDDSGPGDIEEELANQQLEQHAREKEWGFRGMVNRFFEPAGKVPEGWQPVPLSSRDAHALLDSYLPGGRNDGQN